MLLTRIFKLSAGTLKFLTYIIKIATLILKLLSRTLELLICVYRLPKSCVPKLLKLKLQPT